MKIKLFILLTFLSFALEIKAQVEIISTGIGSAYVLNVPAIFPLRNGAQVTFKANVVCSASPTINVTGTGAITIKKEGGVTDLAAGDIKAGQVVNLAYDGTFWQMLSDLGNPATTGPVSWDQILSPAANLTLAHGANTTNFSFTGTTTDAFTLTNNSLTSGKIWSLTSSATGMTGSMQKIDFTGNNVANTGDLLTLSSSGASSLAKALNISVSSTGNLSGGGVRLNFTGAHTGNGLELDDATQTGVGFVINANSITTGNAQYINANGLTQGSGLTLSSSSSAGTGGGTSYLINISRSGANTNASHNAVGVNSNVTNTGTTNNNFGGNFTASGASSTNYGIQATVTGANGNNYSVYSQNTSTLAGSTQYGVVAQKSGALVTGTGYGVSGSAMGSATINFGGSFSAQQGSLNNIGIEASSVGASTLNIGGKFSASGASTNVALRLVGSTSGNLDISPAAVTTSYPIIMPASQGTANTVLANDGSGNLSWNTVAALGGAWNILGNAGTVAATNFIGTTDNIPFSVRVNNVRSGYLDNTNGVAFWGYQAGLGNASASDATAVGQQALFSSNGAFNTAVGYFALKSNTTGADNTAVGNWALNGNLTAVDNSAFGMNAMRNSTYSNQNVALGTEALFTQSFGSFNYNGDNVAVGYRALYSNQPTATTNGVQNTAIGSQALNNNTNGIRNVGLGYQAGTANTTGVDNVYIGTQAGWSGSTAGGNTFVGNFAGTNNTTSNGVSIGYNSGHNNTSGSGNTYLGYQAGFSNATSSSNTMTGFQAGYSSTSFYNAFFGSNAGQGTTTGGFNTFLGTFTGSNNTTGSNNIFIGYSADLNSATQHSKAAAIGYNAKVDADNAMVLGGTGADLINVGIGTVTPNTRLDVAGDFATHEFVANTTTNPISNAGIAGSVSFATITGETANYALTGVANGFDGKFLTIYNGTAFTMTLRNENAASLAANRITTGTGSDITVGGDGSITMIYSNSKQRWIVKGWSADPNSSGPWTKSGTKIYQTSLSDLVGIGNSTPVYPLDVTLATGATHAKFGSSNSLYMIANSPQIGYNIYYNGGWKYGTAGAGGTISFGQEVSQGFSINTAPSGALDAASTLTSRLSVTNTGDVGIGNIAPAINGALNTQLTVSASTVSASKVAGINLQGSTVASFGGISSISTYNVDATSVNQKLTEMTTNTDGAANFGKFVLGINDGTGIQNNMIMDHNGRTVFQTSSNSITLSNVLHVYEINSNATGTDGAFINIHNGANIAAGASPPTIMTGIRFKNTNWAANENFKGAIFFQTLTPRTHGVGNMIFALSNDDATNVNAAASDAVMTLAPTGNMSMGSGINPNYKVFVVRPATDFGADHTGIYGYRTGTNAVGSGGTSWTSSGVDAAVKGYNNWGSQFTAGVAGYNFNDFVNCAGIYGGNQSASYYGLLGYKDGASALWGGYFVGNVNVAGTLSKTAGAFRIDNPLDPENKYLYHSFVESPDMMNIYNGNITTDANGMAVVELPDYFQALNMDYRYQLTVMGDFAQAIVFEKVSHNSFKIKTDKPNIEVSWQVTGIRNDPYAKENRIPNSVDKTGKDKGKYIYPKGYGKPAEMGIDYNPPGEQQKR